MHGLQRALPEDADAAAALAGRAYAVYLDRLGGAPEPIGADYARLIEDALVYVLPGEAGLVASLVLMAEADHLLVWSIAVDPERQGEGFGRRLMAFVDGEARRLGLDEIRLYTNERMSGNVAFYTALGYEETHRSPSRRIAGSELVHMAKRSCGG